MNREIKFRGKSKQDNVFVYGSYVRYNDSRNNPFKNNYKETHQILAYFSGDWNMGGYEYVDVYPETVGQYTGLKDKNGVEIYEGDIIMSNASTGEPIYHDIFYNEEQAAFYAGLDGRRDASFGICSVYQQWIDEFGKVVVGNIHDNPELINIKRGK